MDRDEVTLRVLNPSLAVHRGKQLITVTSALGSLWYRLCYVGAGGKGPGSALLALDPVGGSRDLCQAEEAGLGWAGGGEKEPAPTETP